MRRVVITGLGIVAPTGNTCEMAWENALNGVSGISNITSFDTKDSPVKIAGEVKNLILDDVLEKKEIKRTSRFASLALVASKQAIDQSGLDLGRSPERIGCSIGVGLGGLREIEDNSLLLREKGPRRISPFFIPYAIPNMASGIVSIKHGLRGPNLCTATACASGAHAIGEAYICIKNSIADAMVAGGAESAISPLGMASFNALKALSHNSDSPAEASRPFDKDRDGFVMGEGAGVMILEEFESAKERGANILAEIVGFGMSGDGFHVTAPPEGHEGGKRCMQMALDAAAVSPGEVDYINAHGTSTKLNDLYESQAISEVFRGNDSLSVSSTKGVTGHCLGGAGGIEAVYTVLSISHSIVPPTANLLESDCAVGVDYTPGEAREKKVGLALSNSFGFGGTNATIAFRRFE